ncbi:hypothetical protein [Aestuariibaculum sediminum]|uniref:Nicotinate-nucleotide adenylyltransferase n=1 Tax=Aestuariibaculum sediminum TaxID=2770637 RepID=A0A8J6U854_9FLAO|nr:hypothetical protein [Aestuariibaculum sediminum]MBD0830897.1 hypothetical protein [Aestuariibaculum sediminum]
MKNLLFGFFLLGLTSLGFSQNIIGGIEEVKLADVYLSNINADYLAKVQDENTAKSVKHLENIASRHKITESHKYDGRDDEFKTRFEDANGFINAYYDKDGKILSTSEKYKNIKIPDEVKNTIYSKFPDWSVDNFVYVVYYDSDKDAVKTYQLILRKDNKKKKLKLDHNGNIK